MPLQSIPTYTCDKTEGLGNSHKACFMNIEKAQKPVGIFLATFDAKVNDGEGEAGKSLRFCSAKHANYWLRKLNVVSPLDIPLAADDEDDD